MARQTGRIEWLTVLVYLGLRACPKHRTKTRTVQDKPGWVVTLEEGDPMKEIVRNHKERRALTCLLF